MHNLLCVNVLSEVCIAHDDGRCEDGLGGAISTPRRHCCRTWIRDRLQRALGSDSNGRINLMQARDPVSTSKGIFREFSGALGHIDWILCTMPAVACQWFMVFDVPLVIRVPVPFDLGVQNDEEHFEQWLHDLKLIAANPRNVILAQNSFDAKHMAYLSGIEPLLLSPLNSYWNLQMDQIRRSVTLYSRHLTLGRDVEKVLGDAYHQDHLLPLVWLRNSRIEKALDFSALFKVLAQSLVVVVLPYDKQLSVVTEIYSAAVPILAPSISLMHRWILSGVSPFWQLPWFPRRAISMPGLRGVWPHEDFEAVKEWLALHESYNLPHVCAFASARV